MALILATSINLNEIPKTRSLLVRKVNTYLSVLRLNDELDQFGNQGPVIVFNKLKKKEKLKLKQRRLFR